MRKYLQTPGLLSVSLKTALSFSLAFILMLFSASALAAGSDEALITDTLRQVIFTCLYIDAVQRFGAGSRQ